MADVPKSRRSARPRRSSSGARALRTLLAEARACRVCEAHLPCEPRPILSAGFGARLLIVGQAPGRVVHESGVPWRDRSGDELRRRLGIDASTFYDVERVALLPTGFCFPGAGRSGDLPPRPECAPLWHARFFSALPSIRLTLLVGKYAQEFHLGPRAKRTLTETVAAFREYLPTFFPLPHPSPRNRLWTARNPFFERDVVPALRDAVARSLSDAPEAP